MQELAASILITYSSGFATVALVNYLCGASATESVGRGFVWPILLVIVLVKNGYRAVVEAIRN